MSHGYGCGNAYPGIKQFAFRDIRNEGPSTNRPHALQTASTPGVSFLCSTIKSLEKVEKRRNLRRHFLFDYRYFIMRVHRRNAFTVHVCHFSYAKTAVDKLAWKPCILHWSIYRLVFGPTLPVRKWASIFLLPLASLMGK